MVSEKFMVNSDAERMAAARYATESFAWQAKLDRRDTLRLSLLVEETLGMVKAMVESFDGELWLSSDDVGCTIHLLDDQHCRSANFRHFAPRSRSL